jgi:hypothetical protein
VSLAKKKTNNLNFNHQPISPSDSHKPKHSSRVLPYLYTLAQTYLMTDFMAVTNPHEDHNIAGWLAGRQANC